MNRQLVHSTSSVGRGSGTAVPLVKPTLRGILPHGSEVPWVPIPLRSTELDDSPCLNWTDVGFVQDESPLPPERYVTSRPTGWPLLTELADRHPVRASAHGVPSALAFWLTTTWLRSYIPMNGGATLLD
jgi:hypothetical protein